MPRSVRTKMNGARLAAEKILDTYALEIGLQCWKNLLDRTFDKHTSDEPEALAIWIGFRCLCQCVDHQSKGVKRKLGKVCEQLHPVLV